MLPEGSAYVNNFINTTEEVALTQKLSKVKVRI